MGLFGNKQQGNLKATKEMVEKVIAELGLTEEENRLQTDDGALGWGLMRGSAHVYIFIRPGPADEAFNSIQVVSPLMRVPESDATRLALFRHLLDLNAQEMSGAAFGIKDDTVVILNDRSTQDLDRSEVKEMILRVGYFADAYDDALVTRYGGLRFSD